MVSLVVTPSLDRSWARPLAAVRGSGITPVACLIDPLAHIDATRAAAGQGPLDPSTREPLEREMRALVHALVEHDIGVHVVRPGIALAEQLTTAVAGAGRAVA
jgi:hypothetical protein